MTTLALGLILGLVTAIALSPRRVEYTESIEIAGPVGEVFDSIRNQVALMSWSAWPSETGSECRVDGEDGVEGVRTVYLDKKGQQFGFQELTELTPNFKVEFRLESKGPPQQPVLTFYLVPTECGRTKVVLHFENLITPPFHFLLRMFGVVQWTRNMHKKDLDGLKRFVELGEGYQGSSTS